MKQKPNQTVVMVSSKILRGKSIHLISIETIHNIHLLVRERLDLTFDEFMNGEIGKMLEVTEDVRVSTPSTTIGSLFQLAKLQMDYVTKKKPYKCNRLPTSFGLKRNCLTPEHVDYFSCYIKKNQLLKSDCRESQELREHLNIDEWEYLLNHFEGRVRLEVKLHSMEKIRQHFKLTEDRQPTLHDVLYSQVPVVENMLVRIYGKVVGSSKHCFKSRNSLELLFEEVLGKVGDDFEQAFEYLNFRLNYPKPSREKEKLRRYMCDRERGGQDTLVMAYHEVLENLNENQ